MHLRVKNQAMWSKELPAVVKGTACRAQRQDCIEAQIWGRLQKKYKSATLIVPKSTLASVIHIWKKFGTTRTLPRAGRPAKLSNWWRRALSRLVTKNLMVTLVELHDHTCRWDKHHCNTPLIWALWQSGQTQSSSHWRVKTRENTLGICKTAPKGSSDSEKQDYLVWWTSNLASCLEESCSAHLLQSTSQKKSVLIASSCCGPVFPQQGLGDWPGLRKSWMELSTEISSMKTCSTALRTSDWAEGSPSNMTMTISTQPRHHRSGLGTTLWMS